MALELDQGLSTWSCRHNVGLATVMVMNRPQVRGLRRLNSAICSTFLTQLRLDTGSVPLSAGLNKTGLYLRFELQVGVGFIRLE